MPITTPFSLNMTEVDRAIEAVAGTTVDTVAGNLKIFLGANVDTSKRQSIQGSLASCFRVFKTQFNASTGTGTKVAYGPFLDAVAANITTAVDTVGVGAGDVAIVMDGSFPPQLRQWETTFFELTNQLLERSKDN